MFTTTLATRSHGIRLGIDEFKFRTGLNNRDFLVQAANEEGIDNDRYLLVSRKNISLSNGVPCRPLLRQIWWHVIDPSGNALSSDTWRITPPVFG